MKKVLTLVGLLALVGCEDLSGQLNVSKKFNVNVKGKSQTVEVGNYKTALDFKKDQVVAAIELSSGKVKVNFSTPKDANIPANGNFELKSSQSGQPVDILGDVKTIVTDSQVQRGYESCQYQSYQNICDQNGCHQVPVTRYGQQYTEFFYRDTDRTMDFDMTEVGSVNNKLAHFNGGARYSEKRIIYQDQCR